MSELVISDVDSSSNLRSRLLRILKRAGIKPWPKLFQNLRATCETELLEKYSPKNVCSWIGNSEAVAMKHYAMATDESFTRACIEPSGTMPNRPNSELCNVLGNHPQNHGLALENQAESREEASRPDTLENEGKNHELPEEPAVSLPRKSCQGKE